MVLEEEAPPPVPAWFITFADMMTLLLTFFIMLLSMSEFKTEKLYQGMAQSMRRKFGGEADEVSLIAAAHGPAAKTRDLATLARSKRLAAMQSSPTHTAPAGGPTKPQGTGEPATQVGRIDFADAAPGSSGLSKADQRELRRVAIKLNSKRQEIEIRGHAVREQMPAVSPHRDPWDTTYERCRKAMAYLGALGIDSSRMRISVTAGDGPSDGPSGREAIARGRSNTGVEVWMWNRMR